MTLILSCITTGDAAARRTLDRLLASDTERNSIIVLHPGPVPPTGINEQAGPEAPTSIAGNCLAGGMFGWLVGYGVVSIPGALLGSAVGAIAGAAVGAWKHAHTSQLPTEVHHHYAGRIADDRAAILVRVADLAHYQRILEVFLAEGGQHILTSRDDAVRVEADQLQAIAQDHQEHIRR